VCLLWGDIRAGIKLSHRWIKHGTILTYGGVGVLIDAFLTYALRVAPAALPPGMWSPVLIERKGAKSPELPNGEERNFSPAGRRIPFVSALSRSFFVGTEILNTSAI